MRTSLALLLLAACASPHPAEPARAYSTPRRSADVSGRPVDGKVMSASPQAGIVILNQGRDQGVLVGMKFTLYRGRDFVATAIVREVTREWASATIDLKHIDPRVGDDASNHVLP